MDVEIEEPHSFTSDLKISAKEFNAIDPPDKYYYWVTILEPEKDKSHDKAKTTQEKAKEEEAIGSLMEVTCHLMRYVYNRSLCFLELSARTTAAIAFPFPSLSSVVLFVIVLTVTPLSLRPGQ